MKPICLIRAPLGLGLRPLRPGHEPGTWRAPQALTDAGLVERIRPAEIIDMVRPEYHPDPPPGTMLRNGYAIRAFNLELADHVAAATARGLFPFIVGGDCSVLLGALAGRRHTGPLSLVHVDGHSDFRHPGNEDLTRTPNSVAGMDLAAATGRGDPLITEWPGVPAPLIPDEQVVQIGEREGNDPDYGWWDIVETAFNRIDVFKAREIGAKGVLDSTLATLARRDWPFWLHFDVDALDQAIIPAVDSPGSPGIEPDDLLAILARLAGDERCAGMNFTIFDPDLDPDGEQARWLVGFLGDTFDAAMAGAERV